MDTEMMQAEVPFESNKRKAESVSPASRTESDDDDHTLMLKRARERSSEEKEDDSSDDRESLGRKTDNIVSSASIGDRESLVKSVPLETRADIKAALQRLTPDELFPRIVVSYYNNNKKYDKVMEITGVKVVIHQFIPSASIYFTSFDAKMTAKDGKGTPQETNCCSVFFHDLYSDVPELFSFKLGSLEEKDYKNWFQRSLLHQVLYKASEVGAAYPREETDSDNKEEDVDTSKGDKDVDPDREDEDVDPDREDEDVDPDREDEDVDSNREDVDVDTDGVDEDDDQKAAAGDINKARDRGYKCNCGVISVNGVRVLRMAEEAVTYHNKVGYPRVKLGKIKECFSGNVAVCRRSTYGVTTKPYHLNFDASLMDKDGQETEQTTCQAVISKQAFGGIKVWNFRIPFQGGKETNIWCKEGQCMCEFSYWWDEKEEKKDLLEYVSPEWYPSSKDGWEVVDKKIDA